MAVIVNRILRKILVTVVFCQLIFSARPQLQTDDDGIGEWTDVLADDAVISPYFSSERRTKNKRSVGIDTSKQKPKTSYTRYSRPKYSPSGSRIASNRGRRLHAGKSSKYLQSAGKAAKKSAVIPIDKSKHKPKTLYTRYSRPKLSTSRSRIASNRGRRLHAGKSSKYLQSAGKAAKKATVIPIDKSKHKPKTLYTRYSRPKLSPSRSHIASNRGPRLHAGKSSKYLQSAGKAAKNSSVIPVDKSKHKPKTLYTRYSRPKLSPSRSHIASNHGKGLHAGKSSKYLQSTGKAAKKDTVIPNDKSKHKPKILYTRYSRPSLSPSRSRIASNRGRRRHAGKSSKYLQSTGKAANKATVIPIDKNKHKPKTLYTRYSRPKLSTSRSHIASNRVPRLHAGKSSKYLQSAGKAPKNATAISNDKNKHKPKTLYTQYSRPKYSPSGSRIASNRGQRLHAGKSSKYLQSAGKAAKKAAVIPIDKSKHKPKTSYKSTQYSRPKYSPSGSRIANNRGRRRHAGKSSKYLQSAGKAAKNATVIPVDKSKHKPKTLYTKYIRPKNSPSGSRIASNRGLRLHIGKSSKYLQSAGKAAKNATVIANDKKKLKRKTLYTKYSKPKHSPSRSRIASNRGPRLDAGKSSKYLQSAGKDVKNATVIPINKSKHKSKTLYTQYSRPKFSPSGSHIASNRGRRRHAGKSSKYLQSAGKAAKKAAVIPIDKSKHKPKTSYKSTQYSRPKYSPSGSRIANNRGRRLHAGKSSKYLQSAGKAAKNATVIPVDKSKHKPKTLYTKYIKPKHSPSGSRIASNRGRRLHIGKSSKYLQSAGKAAKNATVISNDKKKLKRKTFYTQYSKPKHSPSRLRIASNRGPRLDAGKSSKYLQSAGKDVKNATVIPINKSKHKSKTLYTQYSRPKFSPSGSHIASNRGRRRHAGKSSKYLQSAGKAAKKAAVIPNDKSKRKPKTLYTRYSRPKHLPSRSHNAINRGRRLDAGKSSNYLQSAGKAAKKATVIPIDKSKHKPKTLYTKFSKPKYSSFSSRIASYHGLDAGQFSKYLQPAGKAAKKAAVIPIDKSKHKPKTLYTQYSRPKHLPSRSRDTSNHGQRLHAEKSSKYLQSAGKADKKATVIPTVSTLTDNLSVSKKDAYGTIINNSPEDKPVRSDSYKPSATVIDAPVALTNNDPCEPNPCQNGGTCRQGLSQNMAFECACPLQYRGKYCHEVTTRCEVIGCQDVTDCVSTPAGAVCICKGAEEGRLCQLDVSNQTQWEKLKMVMSEQTVYTVEIIIGSVLGILILLAVLLAIHCKRVNSKRAVMRKSYKEALDKGENPEEPPPDWCDISNDIIKQTLCCKKKSSLVTDYQTGKKLSRVQSLSKQKEDELDHLRNSRTSLPNSRTSLPNSRTSLLNSRTSLPNSRTIFPNSRTSLPNSMTNFPPSATRLQSYSLLHEIDEALKADGQPQVSPEQIDYEINRRASSLRSMGLNGPASRNQSLNNRYLPTRSGHYKSSGSLTRQLSKPTVANSRRPVVIRPSQTQCKQKYSFIEELQKKASQQTLNGRSSQSLVNADEPQQYDMSGDRDDRTSEHVYGSISQYINNSARRNYFYDKSDNVYLNSNNQERTNTGISVESEQCSYNQEDLARRMGDIKENLKILKSSITQRRDNTRKQTMKRCSKALERNKGQGQVRYATKAMWSEPAVESSNSEDEIEVSDKILVVNMETDLNHGTQGNSRYSAYNKNSNTNTNYSYNEMFPSEIYYKNLNHFEKLEKGYSLNSCSSRVKQEYFNPASVYGHLYRENSESTHCYSNQGPTNLQGTLILDKEEEGNQEFENKGGIHDYEDKNSRSKDVKENMLAHSDGSAGDIEQNGELRAAYKHEMLNTQTDRELDKFQQSHPISEKARSIRPGESEYYGILATTFPSSPQRIDDRNYFVVSKASQPSISSKGTLDSDQIREQNYLNASDNKGQRVYYLSSELESCTLYDSKLPTDSQLAQKESRGASRNDHQNIETNKNEYMCSSPRVLERDEIHQHSQSAVLENTSSTIIGTPNSNDLNVNNVEDSTLVAGINASDAEIEF